jgi:hypothetical protein
MVQCSGQVVIALDSVKRKVIDNGYWDSNDNPR